MVGLGGEKLTEFLVAEQSVEKVDLVNGWLAGLVSDVGGSDDRGEGEVHLPDQGIWHHVEGERRVGDEASSPRVVGSVESGSNLIEVVSGSLSPFPVVVGEDVS